MRVEIRLLGILTLVLVAGLRADGQDVLTIGTVTSKSSTVEVPVYLRDVAGTELGADKGAGSRIQGVAFKITVSPAGTVSSLGFSRAGILAGVTPLWETGLRDGDSILYVGSFSEASSRLALVSNEVAPGNRIGTLTVVLAGSGDVSLSIDFASATLSNQAGTIDETVSDGGLSLVGGSIRFESFRTRGDFDGDGRSDVLWRDAASGVNAVWFMNGASVLSGASLPAVSDAGMKVRGLGDLDGNGKADVVWRNTNSGESAVWLMNGAAVTAGVALPAVTDRDLQIVAVGDVNADGSDDILWRNSRTGENAVWLMDGKTLSSGVMLPAVPTDMSVAGAGDLDGDGRVDIFWRNQSTGVNAVWLMNGGTIKAGHFLPSVTGMVIGGVADFDGDGNADIFWRNQSTGANAVWLMNGPVVQIGAVLPSVTSSMTVGAIGDFDGDGKADVAWRNAKTGENAVWLMDGGTIRQGAYLPAVSGSTLAMVAPK